MFPRRSIHPAGTTPKHQGYPEGRPLRRGQLGPAKQERRLRRTLQNPLEKGRGKVSLFANIWETVKCRISCHFI